MLFIFAMRDFLHKSSSLTEFLRLESFKLKFSQNGLKKGTLKIQKSKIAILVLNQSPISAVFQIVRFPGDQKTTLTRESL